LSINFENLGTKPYKNEGIETKSYRCSYVNRMVSFKRITLHRTSSLMSERVMKLAKCKKFEKILEKELIIWKRTIEKSMPM